MDLEKEGELLWLTCLHNLANAEDGGEIASKNAEDDWLSREGSRATYIMGQVIGKMRKGSMFEKKIRERSHDETKAGGEKKHGRVESHSEQRIIPVMIGI